MQADHYSLFRAELLGRLWPLAAACVCGAAASGLTGRFLLSRLWPLGRKRRAGVAACQSGTSELEFTLAFPVFLVSVLTTIQVALMINANLIVDYAAFCAARSAAVWVPQNLPSEPANSIAPQDPNSEKTNRIHHAASFACAPISPRMSQFVLSVVGGIPGGGILPDSAALGSLAASLAGPSWVVPSALNVAPVQPQSVTVAQLGLNVVDQWLYADRYTTVDVLDASGHAANQFPSETPITVRVTHKYEMTVPLAGAAFGAAFGQRFVSFLGIGVGPYYVPITASYTLLMAHG